MLNQHKEVKQALLEVCFENPAYGTRRLSVTLQKDVELEAGRKLVRNLMAELGIRAIFPHESRLIAPNIDNEIPVGLSIMAKKVFGVLFLND